MNMDRSDGAGVDTGHPEVTAVAPDLYLVRLDQDLTGFYRFIGAWLYTAGPVLLVDVGPAATAPVLIAALDRLGIRPDAILLTHIHLDHAGGIGELSEAFPDAPIYCHPSAIAHLMDPTRLWEGSLKVLGKTARAYGPIRPVPGQRLRATDTAPISWRGTVIDTPGHAIHHVSYQVGPYLFCGEAAGVVFSTNAASAYMRPTTPVRFIFDVYTRSIDRLIALGPDAVCYGHFGLQWDGVTLFKRHRNQLARWRDIISSEMKAAPQDQWIGRCAERLIREDPEMATLTEFDAPVLIREREFLENSIRGFLEYLSTACA